MQLELFSRTFLCVNMDWHQGAPNAVTLSFPVGGRRRCKNEGVPKRRLSLPMGP